MNSGRARGQRWGGRVAGLLVAAVVLVAWVDPGRHVAGGDIGHFVRDRLLAGAVSPWSYELTGAGSMSYEAVRLAAELPFVLLGRLTADWLAQGLFHATVAAAAATGVAALARVLFGHRLRHEATYLVIGVVAVLNPLTLITFPNPNTLLACAAIGWLSHLLLRPSGPGAAVAVACVPFAYLAVNPPTLLLVVLAIVTVVLLHLVTVDSGAGPSGAPPSGGRSARRVRRSAYRRMVVRRTAMAAPLVVLVNLWWAVPWALTLFGPNSPVDTSSLGVDAWSWSHVNNSPGRVLTLTAAWGWDDPLYFPYSARMDRFPLGMFAWALPMTAGAGALLARHDVRIRVLSLAIVPVVVFTSGLHAPFEPLNRFLYDNVPLWWLWREPVSKWGILLLLLELLLAAQAVDAVVGRLADRPEPAPRARHGLAVTAATTAVLSVLVAFVWPLYTGAAIPEQRGALPGLLSSVPDAWHEVAEDLNAKQGRVLVLPLPVFYQTTTTWGFHGVEHVPQQLLTRPVVSPVPGGYGTADTGYATLARTAQDLLLAGDAPAARTVLDKLGVTDVVVRRDVRDTGLQTLSADPDALEAALDTAPWARPARSTEVAAVHSVVSADSDRVDVLPGAVADDVGQVAALLPDTAVIGPEALPDTPPDTVAPSVLLGRVPPTQAGPWVRGAVVGPVVLEAERRPGRLTLRPAGTPVHVPSMTLRVPSTAVLLVGSGPVRRPLPERLAVPADGTTLSLATPTIGLDLDDVQAANCNNTDGSTLADAGIQASTSDRTIELVGAAGMPCAVVDLPDDGLRHLRISWASSSRAGLCVYDDTADECVARTALLSGEHERVVDLPPGASQLYLYLDAADGRAVATFRDPALVDVGSTLRLRPPDVSVDRPTPSTLGPAGLEPVSLAPWSSAQDCARTDMRTPDEVGIAATTSDESVTLTALEHTACVDSVVDVVLGATHRVHTEATGRPGDVARLCLWSETRRRCVASVSRTLDGTGRATLEATAQTSLDDAEVRLFLYADGDDVPSTPATTVSYSGTRVVPLTGSTWVTGPAPAPPVQPLDVQGSIDRLSLRLPPDAEGHLLVLDEGYHPAWQAAGGGAVLDGPFEVDGWRTGFLVVRAGDVRVEHREAVLVGYVQRGSLAIGALLLVLLALRRSVGPRRFLAWLLAEPRARAEPATPGGGGQRRHVTDDGPDQLWAGTAAQTDRG